MAVSWWDLVPSAVGALIGAAAASVPAYLLAARSSKETLARDRLSRKEEQKAAAFRALVKLVTIINGVGTLHRHIEGLISQADAQGHSGLQLWRKVLPLAGFANTELRFEGDDLSVFVSSGEFSYVTDLLQLAERSIALVSAFRSYAEQRKLMTDELATMATAPMEGNLGSIVLTPAELARLEPRSVELEMIVTQLRTFAREDYATAVALGDRFGPLVRSALPDTPFPNLAAGAVDAVLPTAATPTA
jgi:hypothetical protein